MDGVARAIRAAVPAIKEVIDTMVTMAAEVTETIKTMPEEEFNRLIESAELAPEAKAQAMQIRSGGKWI